MSFIEKLLTAGETARAIKAGVQKIIEYAAPKAGVTAETALSFVRRAAQVVMKGLTAEISAKQILEELEKLKVDLASNDAAADSELDKKFRE